MNILTKSRLVAAYALSVSLILNLAVAHDGTLGGANAGDCAVTDDNGQQQVVSADNQAELKRFFVGPNGCEVTGFAITPDYTTVFANIQHPKNWPYSALATEQTPEGMSVRPRAATVVIRKDDGAEVGV